MAREQHNLGNKNGIFSKKKKAFRRTSRYVSLIFSIHFYARCMFVLMGVCVCKESLKPPFLFLAFLQFSPRHSTRFLFTSRITNKKTFSRLSLSLSLSRLFYLFVQGKSSGKPFFFMTAPQAHLERTKI